MRRGKKKPDRKEAKAAPTAEPGGESFSRLHGEP